MANTVGSGFRSFTRMSVRRKYVLNGITYEQPIGLEGSLLRSVDLDPGVTVEDIKGSTLFGSEVTVYTYDQAREGQLQITIGTANSDIEQMLLGRINVADTNFDSWVWHEWEANATTRAALTGSQIGTTVTELTAAGALEDGTYIYYIDGTTGIAVPMTVIDYSGTPANENEIAVGDDIALKVHADLVSNSRTLYFRLPGVYPTVRRYSATPMNQVGVTIWGTNFDGTATRILNVNNCSLRYGTSISGEPERQITLQILPDPNDGTGLGFNLIDAPLAIAA